MASLSLDEYHARVSRCRTQFEGDTPLARDDAADVIRLWNTAAHYRGLSDDPATATFMALVEQHFADRIAPVLEMDVTRGFALRSEELDLTFGGNLPEGSRYLIRELEHS